ncbi:hypothetical protein PsYK624_090500 [Phanerochaete sordida]|uniref:Uncharacterized protein n=1 Tax=Phanerochaete sordida TaxID=48140 RepID=A0A9P3LGA9_9APHY|nr:hypothetical protein PsYK624_090500 [Phanerochaete sordida]
MKVVIDAPPAVVWDILEKCDSDELDWNPFSRVYTLIKRAGHPVATPFAGGRRSLAAQPHARTLEVHAGARACRETHELPPWEKGVKCAAESVHTVRALDGVGEQTEYELAEAFFTTQQCWQKDMNPGVMEKCAREFAAALKRAAERR